MGTEFQSANPKEFSGSLVRPRWFYRQWMLAGNPAYFFERLARDHGDFVHYRGLFSFYLLNHPALVKQVLMETHKSFDKRNIIYKRFSKAFGDGLTVSEGEKWKRHRRLMQPMFGPITVRKFFDSMFTAANDFADRWKAEYAAGTSFDIAKEMDQLTLRIAGEAFFSEGFQQDADRISAWNERINHYCAKPPLPIIRSFWFPSTVNRRLRRESGPQNDLLSILLEARHEDDGSGLSDGELKEEVLGMILGGHETSSSALAWIWYELDRNPEVRQKINQELDLVLGGEPLTMEKLPRLKYIRMVIDESMRLHPPFWFENRNAMQDVEVGGHVIPKGSIVIFTRYALHRHPAFWSEPTRFNPQRQDPDSLEHPRSAYAQVPFGGGPRICIGINFAIGVRVTLKER